MFDQRSFRSTGIAQGIPDASIVNHARPIALILIGVALGATLVAPVAAQVIGSAPDAVIATTQTRSASCAGLDFYPTDSATEYSNLNTLRVRFGTVGTGIFRCDPGLPTRAVVTKVQFTLHDLNPYGDAGPCALVRSGLTVTEAQSGQVMASVPPTAYQPGTVRVTDTTIDYNIIDNSKYGYWFECSVAPYSVGINGIFGANVIYTISSTNG